MSPHCSSLPVQVDASAALAKAREERDFLKALNDTLLANQKDFQVGHACVHARVMFASMP